MDEGDLLEGTQPRFPSGTSLRRAASFGRTRSGGRLGRAEKLRGFAGRGGTNEFFKESEKYTILMKAHNTWRQQNNHDVERTWRHHTSLFLKILQRYINHNSVLLASNETFELTNCKIMT